MSRGNSMACFCFWTSLLCAISPIASTSVPEVTIAPGVSMPMLAFGTMHSSLIGCSVPDAVKMALKVGWRHIDMSKMYNTEKEVGIGLRESGVPRSELFLTAKIEGPIGFDATLEQVAKYDCPDVGVDYFDLLLIHWPSSDDKKQERLATWRALEHLKATGKVRAIGVSNYQERHLKELYDAGYQPAVNQVQWHLGYHDEALRRYAISHGTHLEAWAALAAPVAKYSHPGVDLNDPRLVAVALKYNASTVQVAFQWMVKTGVTPVTGSCNEMHAKSDLESFSFDLSSADVAYLTNLKIGKTEERPKGSKDMGTWTRSVYTHEQQKRLGIDEYGKPTPPPSTRANALPSGAETKYHTIVLCFFVPQAFLVLLVLAVTVSAKRQEEPAELAPSSVYLPL